MVGDPVIATEGPDDRRLEELKSKYTARNVLNIKQNIRPLSRAAPGPRCLEFPQVYLGTRTEILSSDRSNSKSELLLVTTVAPWRRAVSAINVSF